MLRERDRARSVEWNLQPSSSIAVLVRKRGDRQAVGQIPNSDCGERPLGHRTLKLEA